MRAVLLDDDPDLLDSLADLLEASGCTCATAHSLEEMIGLGPSVLSADVAVLDINLGPGRPSGLDAHEWLLGHGFPGRIFFLTGHARSHPLVARAQKLGQAAVLEKPAVAEVLLRKILGEP